MDGILYPASLVVLAILIYVFYQNRNSMLMFIAIVIGIYIIYSQETGHTATEFKNELIESIDGEAKDFSKSRGTEGYDANKAQEGVK
ncbi:MAG: hypothetical protein U9Q29_08580 [Campylobacterota bacterium]|nr:hypothetical protein [Campylobacterota bacterium]